MKDWSKLEGKKIIMLGCDILNPIEIGVIVGCDPDIGICIADPDDLQNPWWICKGPLAPLVLGHYPDWWKEKRRKELKCVVKMLQSGYYSWWEDNNNELRIWGHFYSGTTPISCPFSE